MKTRCDRTNPKKPGGLCKPQTSDHCPPKKSPQLVGEVLLGFHTRSGEQMLRQTDDEIQIGVDHRLETFSNLGSNDK